MSEFRKSRETGLPGYAGEVQDEVDSAGVDATISPSDDIDIKVDKPKPRTRFTDSKPSVLDAPQSVPATVTETKPSLVFQPEGSIIPALQPNAIPKETPIVKPAPNTIPSHGGYLDVLDRYREPQAPIKPSEVLDPLTGKTGREGSIENIQEALGISKDTAGKIVSGTQVLGASIPAVLGGLAGVGSVVGGKIGKEVGKQAVKEVVKPKPKSNVLDLDTFRKSRKVMSIDELVSGSSAAGIAGMFGKQLKDGE